MESFELCTTAVRAITMAKKTINMLLQHACNMLATGCLERGEITWAAGS